MRIKALALVVCVSLLGCEFSVKHPALGIGITTGVIGLSTCELAVDFDGSSQKTCGVVGAAAGVGLGLIVALAVLLGGDGHTVLVNEPPPPIERAKEPAPAPAPPPAPPPAPAPAPVPAPAS